MITCRPKMHDGEPKANADDAAITWSKPRFGLHIVRQTLGHQRMPGHCVPGKAYQSLDRRVYVEDALHCCSRLRGRLRGYVAGSLPEAQECECNCSMMKAELVFWVKQSRRRKWHLTVLID